MQLCFIDLKAGRLQIFFRAESPRDEEAVGGVAILRQAIIEAL